MAIDKIYRVTIDFVSPSNFDEDCMDEFMYLNETEKWDFFTGNMACNASVKFESESLEVADSLSKKIISRLEENGCEIVE